MKKLLTSILLSSFLFVVPSYAGDAFQEATVVKHIDGDTIDVSIDGETKRVKMIGIDAPEIREPNKPVQFFGKEAFAYTEKRLPLNTTVYLQSDVSDTDKYGRLLSYVWYQNPPTNDPTEAEIKQYMHNAKLVANGYATSYTASPDVRYSELFTNLAITAQKNHWGLWINGDPKQKAKAKAPVKTYSQPAQKPAQTALPSAQGKIKGNINKKGEKIYHVPGGAYYNKTVAEVYFNTEAEAQGAGYRRSKR